MTIDVKVEALPESVADALVGGWSKSVGDQVRRDESLVELETDKVVLEIPMPVDGVLLEIKASEGTTVTPGDVLAVIEEAQITEATSSSEPTENQESSEHVPADANDAGKLSPSVRRLIDEHNIDPKLIHEQIRGSGKDGRLTKSDVLDFVGGSQGLAQDNRTSSALAPVVATGGRTDRRVPMTRMRSRIAERMIEAQATAAMLTSFNEVDLTEIKALRANYRDRFLEEHGVKLGFMSFFVAAAVKALKKFPVVNASVEDNQVVYHDYYDIGIAVSTERGLVVPVLRNAERMTLADIEKGIRNFAAKARDGKISLEELTGGTFSITNGGVFGSMMSTPILNMPQSAILGMHAIMDRPMAVDGTIEIRPMMYLALTYDHRIVDGADAVQFLVEIKKALEDPARILLQI